MAVPLDAPTSETRPIRLHGVVHSEGRRFLVGVVSLSENGFACTGASLAAVGADIRLTLALAAPRWSPRASSPRGTPPSPALFEAHAEVTTVTPSRGASACQVLAARFVGLAEPDLAQLREFLGSHEGPGPDAAPPGRVPCTYHPLR